MATFVPNDSDIVIRQSAVECRAIRQLALDELKLLSARSKSINVTCDLVCWSHSLQDYARRSRIWKIHSCFLGSWFMSYPSVQCRPIQSKGSSSWKSEFLYGGDMS
jgi:hypothetical protein